MVFRWFWGHSTIIIKWFPAPIPLVSMVFQWFWGLSTIGFNGFQWSWTIGPTMRWFQSIAHLYFKVFLARRSLVKSLFWNYDYDGHGDKLSLIMDNIMMVILIIAIIMIRIMVSRLPLHGEVWSGPGTIWCSVTFRWGVTLISIFLILAKDFSFPCIYFVSWAM